MGPGRLTKDTLLNGRVRLQQPAEGYRAAIDPVFLAASILALPGEKLLELGCGAGAASLCLAWRIPAVAVVGVDLQGGCAGYLVFELGRYQGGYSAVDQRREREALQQIISQRAADNDELRRTIAGLRTSQAKGGSSVSAAGRAPEEGRR